MRGSEYSAPRDARSAGRVGAGGREPGQSVCVRYGKAQSSGFAAGRAVLGKDRLLAGFKVNMSAGRGGAAAQLAVAAAFIAAWLVPNSTELAVANGDTRTVILSDQHTNESGSFTFMVNGVYDQAVLDKLNWFCRDWRLNEPTKMDPHLFDIIWEVYRESGSTQPIDVLSAYRSPQTNAMLRRRSRQVAEHSQHMEGKAIDAHFIDVGTARIRDIAMRMQEGGVGFYPTGITPWVHIDSGSVRYWPRMSRDALTRLFPDGKTVFIPADGQPMPGYEQARAEIEARGGQVQVAGGGFGIFSWLFGARGGGADDAEEDGGQEATTARHAAMRAAAAAAAAAGRRAAGPGRRRGPGSGRKSETQPADRPRLRRAPPNRAPAAKSQALDRRARGSRHGQAQLADRSGLRQRRRAGAGAPGQAGSGRDAGAARRRERRFARPDPRRFRGQVVRAAAAATAGRPRHRRRACRRSDAAGASGGTDPCLGREPRRRRCSHPARHRSPQRGLLPKVITAGVDTAADRRAGAGGSAQPRQKYDDSALLARAAALTAPLPPMPIPNVAPRRASQPAASASQPKAHGGSGVLLPRRWRAGFRPAVRRRCRSARSRPRRPRAAPYAGDLRGSAAVVRYLNRTATKMRREDDPAPHRSSRLRLGPFSSILVDRPAAGAGRGEIAGRRSNRAPPARP